MQLYEVILKNGRVLDAAQGVDEIMDIAVANGKIAALGQGIQAECHNILDCSGKTVVPGFFDAHVHCYPDTYMGVTPDACGVYSAVPTVVDGGSAGYMTFRDFYERYISRCATDVYALLHCHPVGQYAHGVSPHIHQEQWDSRVLKTRNFRILETVAEFRGRIVGLKNRAIDSFIEYKGLAGIDEHLALCDACSLPYVVHIGCDSSHLDDGSIDGFTRGLLERLRPGDIICHAFTGRRGGIIREDGAFDDVLQRAVERGVLLDACTALINFSSVKFKLAMQRGFKPRIISSDFTWRGLQNHVGHFYRNLSRFMALGLPLPEVVAMSTIRPAAALGLSSSKGTLEVGRAADISVFTTQPSEYEMVDLLDGASVMISRMLVPAFCLREGRIYRPVHSTAD